MPNDLTAMNGPSAARAARYPALLQFGERIARHLAAAAVIAGNCANTLAGASREDQHACQTI